MRRCACVGVLAATLLAGAAAPAGAQAPEQPYDSPEAQALHQAALENRARREDSVVRYTALVRQRMAAGLRMPLKDRTLFRSESTRRVLWWRDGRTLVQVLALREQTPMGVDADALHPPFSDAAFDPLNDRLMFGFASTEDMEDEIDPDDYWFEHPLVAKYADHYRFSVGDSLTLSLPDGRRIRAVELQVVPTVADVHRMSGSLWIEKGTGALVRAVFRLSDTFDAFRDTDLREEESRELPPPIWEDAPGFTSVDELEEYVRALDALPDAPASGRTPATFRWGWQRTDLLRYNRVEGVSVGARGQLYPSTPLGPLSLTATVRLGAADREPNARLDVTRETLLRRVMVSGFRELAAVEEGARHLELGNSLTAVLFGRDDGDYYLRTGGALEWTPPASERASFRVRAYTERHDPATASADFALRHLGRERWRFRPNLAADAGWDAGGEVTLAPWWGSDPREPQGGLEIAARVAHGTWSYRTASLGGRLALPFPADFRLAVEAGGGTSWGAPPEQRRFAVGGASTLRGYEPRALAGTSFARARAEFARHFAFGALSLFGDGGWAGERSAFALDDALASAGVGLSLVDGLIRADAAWGLRSPRGFRLELYLDGIL